MKVAFTILGEPQGKGRPKFSKRGQYVSARTPEKTVLYENLIQVEYQRQCGAARFQDGDALKMEILAFYAIPASASQKKKRAMESEAIRPTKKPDLDNVFKVFADSLNQVAYRDDAQIVVASIRKFYSDEPRVFVEISNELEEAV